MSSLYKLNESVKETNPIRKHVISHFVGKENTSLQKKLLLLLKYLKRLTSCNDKCYVKYGSGSRAPVELLNPQMSLAVRGHELDSTPLDVI